MKKAALLVVGAIISLTTGISDIHAACSVTRGVIKVSQGQGSTCSSIQDAIDATTGLDPVIIKVMPGTYTENITMNSYVNLQGSGLEVTTIDTDSALENIVVFNNISSAAISGFTIRSNMTNNNVGIKVSNASPYISDMFLVDNKTAIYNETNSSPSIIGNKIKLNNSIGIENVNSSSIIKQNTIEGNGADASGCDQGIVNRSSSPHIEGNTISDCSCNGISHYNSTPIMSGNKIMNNYNGMWGDTSSAPTLSGNMILGNSYVGIYLSGSNLSTVINNKITANGTYDIHNTSNNFNISFNVFSSSYGFTPNSLNVYPNGTSH